MRRKLISLKKSPFTLEFKENEKCFRVPQSVKICHARAFDEDRHATLSDNTDFVIKYDFKSTYRVVQK